MTICKIRDKPFDVLTKNRVADMTSGNWASRLVDEREIEIREVRLTIDLELRKKEQNFSNDSGEQNVSHETVA